MTDAIFHSTIIASGAASTPRFRWFAALRRSLDRATNARDTRRTLDELPDNLLKDIGLTRSEIPFIADALASGTRTSAGPAPESALGRPMPPIRLIV